MSLAGRGMSEDGIGMRCAISGFCFLVCSVSAAFANGGGYFRGGVEKAGDLTGFEPKATENIRMLDEKLTIKLGPKEADVEIRYLMRNITDKKVNVRFGFPVEESFDTAEWSVDRRKPLDGNSLSYCKNYIDVPYSLNGRASGMAGARAGPVYRRRCRRIH